MSNLPISSPIKGPGLTKPGVVILQFLVIFLFQAIELALRSSLGIITCLAIWIAFFGAIYLGRPGTAYVTAVGPPVSLLISSIILMPTVAELRKRFPNLIDPPSDDICYATQNRQVAIKEIAPKSDLVLVVGSTNSSNSVRLVEVSLEYGAKAAYLIDYAAEAKDEWLEGVSIIGVSSGASVPEILVKDLLTWLADRGFSNVEVVTATEEHLLFSLPVELRKDLKAASK